MLKFDHDGDGETSHPVAFVRRTLEKEINSVTVVHAHGLRGGGIYLRLKNRTMVKRVVDAVDISKEFGFVSFVLCEGD